MKIEIEFFSKVTVWEKNKAVIDVDNEEDFKKMVQNEELLHKCNDINYIDTEYFWETVADTGEYDFENTLEDYEIIEDK